MKPIKVGELKKLLKGMPDGASVVLLSDEEGNAVHHLYAVQVDNEKNPRRVYLVPAGRNLEE
jgi:hypothetical protein